MVSALRISVTIRLFTPGEWDCMPDTMCKYINIHSSAIQMYFSIMNSIRFYKFCLKFMLFILLEKACCNILQNLFMTVLNSRTLP